jgi:hypothetical protein
MKDTEEGAGHEVEDVSSNETPKGHHHRARHLSQDTEQYPPTPTASPLFTLASI